MSDRQDDRLRNDSPIPPPPADFPQLQWQPLARLPSQLPVGNYSQYEIAFSRSDSESDAGRLYVHAIQERNSHMGVVTLGFRVSVEPVGFATMVGGEAGYYLNADLLAWARRNGDSLSIPIASYHLFSGSGLTVEGRTWLIGTDALRAYFKRRAREAGARQEANRDWFWQRVKARGRWRPPFERELQVLGLESMPATVAELKTAWKERLRVCHPDAGGDTAKAQEIGAAFEALRAHLES